MMLSPSRQLFMATLVLGIAISVGSSSWFGVWMGLELNLLSFIPLISMKDNQYSSEAALKYFLIQALGSTVLLMSGVMIVMNMKMFSASLSAALLLKAGSAPFHFWFPPTLEGMLWPQAVTLMTVQKIAPMSLLSFYTSEQESLILTAAVSCAVVGALGGLNQTLLRKLMAYSSINHMGWMMSALLMSESTWLAYFLVYSVMSASIVFLFYLTQTFHFSHLMSSLSADSSIKAVMFMNLLSLGGLPPFTGFIPKWLVIQQLCASESLMLLAILLGSSLFTLFYYLRISLSSLVLSSMKVKWSKKAGMGNKVTASSLSANLMGLLVPSVIYVFLA